MLALLRSFAGPLFSLALMMMASGLFNTFVSVRMEIDGFKPEVIGIVTSALYLGILAGSLKIDLLILKIGHARGFIFCALVLAALVLAQAFWIDPWYWSSLRFIGGICMAGIFIVIESWLLMKSSPEMRGGILSVYLAIFYAALSSGQFLINLSDPAGIYPFLITALLLALSVIPISIRKIEEPKIEEEPIRLSLPQLFRISPLGFIGGIVSGMLLAVVYGLVPVYAREVGMSFSEIGTFMAIIIFGGFSLQWPLGRWADKGDRRRVLNIASFLTAGFAVAIALVNHSFPTLLLLLAWLFGGFSFTLYPLSMAYTCEKVQEEQIVAVTGGFVLSYGMGAILGPLIAPFSMNLMGSPGLFYFLAAISLILGLIGLKRPVELSDRN